MAAGQEENWSNIQVNSPWKRYSGTPYPGTRQMPPFQCCLLCHHHVCCRHPLLSSQRTICVGFPCLRLQRSLFTQFCFPVGWWERKGCIWIYPEVSLQLARLSQGKYSQAEERKLWSLELSWMWCHPTGRFLPAEAELMGQAIGPFCISLFQPTAGARWQQEAPSQTSKPRSLCPTCVTQAGPSLTRPQLPCLRRWMWSIFPRTLLTQTVSLSLVSPSQLKWRKERTALSFLTSFQSWSHCGMTYS